MKSPTNLNTYKRLLIIKRKKLIKERCGSSSISAAMDRIKMLIAAIGPNSRRNKIH